jgi:hypothetical protein
MAMMMARSPSTPDDLPVKGLNGRTLSIEELIEQGERQMREAQTKISSAKKVANAGSFSSKKAAALPPKAAAVQQQRQRQQQQQHNNEHAAPEQPLQKWANDDVQDEEALSALYASADTSSRAKGASETHASELLEFEAIERELLASSPDDIDDDDEWSEQQHSSTAAPGNKAQNYAAYDSATAAVDADTHSDDADLEELSHAEGLLDADKYPWHGASNTATATADDADYDYDNHSSSSAVQHDGANSYHSTEQQEEEEAELQSANSYQYFSNDAEHSTTDIAGDRTTAHTEESNQFDDSHAWGDDTGADADADIDYYDDQHEHQSAMQAANALPASARVSKASLMSNEHAIDTEAVRSSQRYAATITINFVHVCCTYCASFIVSTYSLEHAQ